MVNKIINRMNGTMMDAMHDSRKLLNCYPNDLLTQIIYKRIRNIFWFGRFSANMNDKLVMKYIKSVFKEEFGYYELKGLKLNYFDLAIFSELCEMWFPYYYKEWAPSIFGKEIYEQYDVFVEEDDVIFDLGANIGIFSIYASKKVKCKVYAFEPVGYTHNILNDNINLNNLRSIIPIKKGISNINGYTDIYYNLEKNIGASSIISDVNSLESETIELTTIDNFVKVNNVERIDFIKADIEGAERLMLEGAKHTLKYYKPKLAICTYHLYDDKEVLTKLILDANPKYEIKYSGAKLFAK